MKELVHLEGKYCILEEIQPKYFSYVVEWRNNPKLNKYLNQPFELTLELEKKWYEEIYLNDPTQGLCIVIDKQNMKPFGTTGFTDLDTEKKCCIGGRLLLGDESYSNHPAFLESFFIGTDNIYNIIDVMYAHVVKKNRKALQINKMFGFIPNTGEIQYPQELHRNGHDQIELYRTKERYLEIREKLFDRLGETLFT